MPGHVHTLGILRHSRSRHDRHNHETFGDDDSSDPHAGLAVNPTGDPVLDARMVEEEEEMARRRKHYANTEDEYAGLMSQVLYNSLLYTVQGCVLCCTEGQAVDHQHPAEPVEVRQPLRGRLLLHHVPG